MKPVSSYIKRPAFNYFSPEEAEDFLQLLRGLIDHHIANCDPYRNILEAQNFHPSDITSVQDIPFIPARLFKELELVSSQTTEQQKVLVSSGTSGVGPSKIVLDKQNSADQMAALINIVGSFLDIKRGPMVILDCPSTLKNRNAFNGRGAGISGLSAFARHRIFAFNDDMELEVDDLHEFLEEHRSKKILFFGFTYLIWEFFVRQVIELGLRYDLKNAVLIHGGGWKKMAEASVSNNTFRQSVTDLCGITSVHNYYGMVEQAGSIFLECEQENLHVSSFSDVLIRDPASLDVVSDGKPGLIEVISILPTSYPGNAILTEDEGFLVGFDDCPCGRPGKTFKVNGRIPHAEIRGCGDTFAA